MSDLAIIQKPLAPDLIKRMAMEIGKETVAYVEYMYPEAIKATSSTFRLSLRNTIYNEAILYFPYPSTGGSEMRAR